MKDHCPRCSAPVGDRDEVCGTCGAKFVLTATAERVNMRITIELAVPPDLVAGMRQLTDPDVSFAYSVAHALRALGKQLQERGVSTLDHTAYRNIAVFMGVRGEQFQYATVEMNPTAPKENG